jgi:hypothetical protein
MKEKGKNFSALGVTVITISFKPKIIIKCSWNHISTRNAGVTFSQKRDAEKSIIGKIKEKKNHGKANFTMCLQKCEEKSSCKVHFTFSFAR